MSKYIVLKDYQTFVGEIVAQQCPITHISLGHALNYNTFQMRCVGAKN